MKTKLNPARLMIRVLLIMCLIVNSVESSQGQQVKKTQNFEMEKLFQKPESALPEFSILSAFAEINNENSTSQCQKELKLILNGFLARKAWAMKVVDATGTKLSGFLFGQNLWLGSRATCTAAQYPVSVFIKPDLFDRIMDFGILNETAPFDVNFKVAYLDFKARWQVEWLFIPPENTIAWGLCLPASCSNTEIADIINIYIKSESFVERKVYGIDPSLDHVKTLEFSNDFFKFTSVRIFLGILCFTFIMIIAAMLLRYKSRVTKKSKEDGSEKVDDKSKAHEFNPILDFIKCFDINENMNRIFRINNSVMEINSISTIRTIVANSIIILHVIWYGIFACVNRATFLTLYHRPAVSYIYVCVEPFFVISGFLLTYNFLRSQQKRQLIKNARPVQLPMIFFKSVVHRWLRLAPLYLVIVCLDTVLHALLYQISVYKLSARDDVLMAEYWPRYLLFTQNFIHDNFFPVNWTWSTACEMQFFLVGTVLLYIYARRPNLSKLIYLMMVLGTLIAYISIALQSKFYWNFDAAVFAFSETYLHSEVRIISYLIGMLGGWYTVERPFTLPHKVESVFRDLSIVLFGLLMSPLTDSLNSTSSKSVLVLLLLRVLISFWIFWLIYADVTKRRFWLSSILEVKVFQPTARLSYGIYLLNPIIINAIIGFTNMGLPFDLSLIVVFSAGYILLTKWISVIFSVAFELPYANLSALLLKPKMAK